MTGNQDQRPHYVVVGGGAGGIELITRLTRIFNQSSTRLTLVDESPIHFWKPRLHEIAAGLIGTADERVSFLGHGQRHGYHFELGRFEALDYEDRSITIGAVMSAADDTPLLPRRVVRYDKLVLAFGSRVNDFGTPGAAEHCHMLDRPELAEALHRQIFEAAVRANLDPDAKVSVGIVGGGATGVELAAELHHAFEDLRNFGGIHAERRLHVVLIDMADRILPGGDERISRTAMERLRKLGVVVRLKTGVKAALESGFLLSDDSFLPCEIRVWAAGVTGLGIARQLAPLKVTGGGRLVVNDHLACDPTRAVYAIGDCAAAAAADGSLLYPTAQAAHQQAAYLANAFRLEAAGRTPGPFRFRPRGMLVSLGRARAAAEVPIPFSRRRAFGGPMAKLLYVSLEHMHRATIHGWPRAIALFLADRLRGTAFPPVKLH